MNFLSKLFLFLLIAGTIQGQDQDLKDWYHKDPSTGTTGVSVYKAYNELLEGMESQPVIVAIIDSGIDIEHEDLKDVIWTNAGEIPNNGIDDDGNGYVDDVHGWNFIGGRDGRNVGPETYEVTRLYAKYKEKFEDANPDKLNKKDKKLYEQWLVWKKEVDEKRAKAQASIDEMKGIEKTIMASFDALGKALEEKDLDLTMENIKNLESDDKMVMIAKQVAPQFLEEGDINTIDQLKDRVKEEIASDLERQKNQLEYAYNPDYDSRKEIVKDNYNDPNERYYGNNNVEGPDALHGTHVGGIVAAQRNNGIGMNGIADNVKLMSVRAVPDGDERDKDVANAIYYAVDNGASVINMSFGKGYAWDKDVVDKAMRYAEKHDVLLVHAAGNSAQNNDNTDNFPNDKYRKPKGNIFCKKKKVGTWIEVGALSYKQGEDYVAPFSNYGKENVDLFAPGMKIYSTLPDDKYRYLQGTSMASPVVAGVAAVLRSYFPKLTAKQVKKILMDSVVPLDIMVKKPGTSDLVPFSDLSVTGGVVNLAKAIKLAKKTKGKKKIKRKGA